MKKIQEKTRITILCENTAAGPQGLLGEHGFAALVERGDDKLLFDTGQSISLAQNAEVLGVDLTEVKTVVLSHGHYDHTGGLEDVVFPPRGVEVIAHPDVFDEKYAVVETGGGEVRRYIGIKFRQKHLEAGGATRFRFVKGYEEVWPGVFFSGEVPRKTSFEAPDTRLKVRRGDELVQDPLRDDASLLVETSSGPVVICGCAHAGVINVLNHLREKSGHETLHAVIGGTHLGYTAGTGPQLEKTMDAFDEFGLELIGVAHCTGQRAASVCHARFGPRFAFASVGWTEVF